MIFSGFAWSLYECAVLWKADDDLLQLKDPYGILKEEGISSTVTVFVISSHFVWECECAGLTEVYLQLKDTLGLFTNCEKRLPSWFQFFISSQYERYTSQQTNNQTSKHLCDYLATVDQFSGRPFDILGSCTFLT